MSDPKREKMIQRYTASQRINHWLIAGTFILLTLSGLALFHPAFFFLSHVLGGGPWTRILHPFIGVVMFVCFFIFAARMLGHNMFARGDLAWLLGFKETLSGRDDHLPPAGRYNAGQKVLFWALLLLMLGLLATGVVMWREFFSAYFPIWALRIASMLHALFALLMICAIIVHVYAGIWTKGSIKAMTRGTVSPGWAWKHHRAWYREWLRKQPPQQPK